MITMQLNSRTLAFDKEKTKIYQEKNCHCCDCQACRNYYKSIENNKLLKELLSSFGLSYLLPEEIIWFSLDDKEDSLIHYEAYYGVEGNFDGEEFSIEDCNVKIDFRKEVNLLQDIPMNYFWIVLNKNFPYILSQERDI